MPTILTTLGFGRKQRSTYKAIGKKPCKGWKPILQRFGSYSGSAKIWSTSTNMVEIITRYAKTQLRRKNTMAKINGTKKCKKI